MVILKLARAGAKKRPVYHVVVKDSRAARDGRFIEKLGYFIPDKDVLVLAHDRIDYWTSKGAQASDTVRGLINRSKRMPAAAVVAPI